MEVLTLKTFRTQDGPPFGLTRREACKKPGRHSALESMRWLCCDCFGISLGTLAWVWDSTCGPASGSSLGVFKDMRSSLGATCLQSCASSNEKGMLVSCSEAQMTLTPSHSLSRIYLTSLREMSTVLL